VFKRSSKLLQGSRKYSKEVQRCSKEAESIQKKFKGAPTKLKVFKRSSKVLQGSLKYSKEVQSCSKEA
jgi:hypothetical protein